MEVKPIKVINRKKYNVCISVSLFKMDNPYREFGKYVGYFFRWINKIPKNYFVRLYTDDITYNSEEFKLILEKNNKHLELFLYDYPEFRSINGYHDGTFGSITRFLALFDNRLRKEVDYVWISDIDVQPFYFDYSNIKLMKARKVNICYMSKSIYGRPWIPDSVDYPVINAKIIIDKTVKFSKKQFDDYLRDVLNGMYKEVFDKIIDYYKYKRKPILGPNDKYFIYGFDEIYTNQILYKEIIKYTRLIVYHLSLTQFRHVKKIELNIPNIDLLDDIEAEIYKGNNSRMSEFIKLNNEVYDYLTTKNLEPLNYRYKRGAEDYKKYINLINKNNKEFAVYLLVKN